MRTTTSRKNVGASETAMESGAPSHRAAVMQYWNKCDERTAQLEKSLGKSEYSISASAIGIAIVAEHLNGG